MKYLIIVLLLVSCNTKQKKEVNKPTKLKPITSSMKYTFKWDNQKYTKYLVDSLKTSELIKLKPTDIKQFGVIKDPIRFYGNILVEMAYYESKFNTMEKYKESFGLWSRGLFQLSKEDGKRYKCNFTTEQSVHNAKANIECAILILQKLVKQDNHLAGRVRGKWKGGARYWAVLRGTRKYTKKALQAIKNINKI